MTLKISRRPGCVYLAKLVYMGEYDGPKPCLYKIGMSGPVGASQRMVSIGSSLPFGVEEVACVRSEVSHLLERALHTHYTEKRVKGEWFNLTDEDVEEFSALAQEIDDSLIKEQHARMEAELSHHDHLTREQFFQSLTQLMRAVQESVRAPGAHRSGCKSPIHIYNKAQVTIKVRATIDVRIGYSETTDDGFLDVDHPLITVEVHDLKVE